MTEYQTIRVTKAAEHVGAHVESVDLAAQLDARTTAELQQAFGEHGVLFFRKQRLSPEALIAFAERFGPVNVNRFFGSLEGYPKIAMVVKEPHHQRNIGGCWHTDHSYDAIPALGSALYAREVPSSGGDTMFSNLSAVFEALSDGLKQTLRGLRARHSSRHVFGEARHATEALRKEWEGRVGNPDEATQDVVHPVIVHHPDTGREILYVNKVFTLGFEGWSDEESAPLLNYLYDFAIQPQFTYRFSWQPDSLALWDNRSTWHYALNDYPGERRYMHRITIEGVPLEGSRPTS